MGYCPVHGVFYGTFAQIIDSVVSFWKVSGEFLRAVARRISVHVGFNEKFRKDLVRGG